MPDLRKSFDIKAKDFVNAGKASLQVQRILKAIGFEPTLVRRVSVCAYEGEMNIVMHGGNGALLLTLDPAEIIMELKDGGPGIENVDMALQEGFSTATDEYREMGFGAGMGLPNIEKNSDSLEIRSEKGKGTYLKVCFRVDEDS